MNRKQHAPAEKAHMVLEALRGEKTINEIASEHGIHPNMLSRWKREAEENLYTLFKNDSAQKRREQREHEAEMSELYAKIGELTTHVEWLKKIWSLIPHLSNVARWSNKTARCRSRHRLRCSE